MLLNNGEINLIHWQKHGSGSFITKLFEAMRSADDTNLGRLGKGFPEEVEAFNRYRKEGGYWDDLQSRFEHE